MSIAAGATAALRVQLKANTVMKGELKVLEQGKSTPVTKSLPGFNTSSCLK